MLWFASSGFGLCIIMSQVYSMSYGDPVTIYAFEIDIHNSRYIHKRKMNKN